ncbi:MAG: ComEA family DNA-binding protein [Dehalococcoidales bacterium]
MEISRRSKFWLAVIIFLIAVIIIGGTVIWSKYSPARPMEISLLPAQEWQGTIFITGNITTPGFYPFATDDSLGDLIQTAGGAAASANLSRLKLYVSGEGEEEGAQKIDINRAEIWLLEALPGIGETLAQRIVDYRRQNGLFRNTKELLEVAGIGTTTYERIKDLISVAD